MSCTTSSDPAARDFFAGGVDSYLDTITKYAGIGGTEPKLPGYAKLGSATTVINMAQAAGKHDYGGVAKAYSTGVAAYVVGDVAFTALAGIAIAAGGGVLAIGAAAVAATGLGLAAAWGIGTVGQSYKKYKDSFSSTTEKVQLTTQPVVKDIKATAKALDRINSDSKKLNAGFNENAGEHLTKENLKDLL